MNKIFKDNEKLQQYFETSDKTKFYDEDLAKNHARSLADRRVKTVHRGDEPTETQEEPVVTNPIVKKVAKEIIVQTAESEAKTKLAKEEKEEADSLDSKDLTPMAAAKLRIGALDKLQTVADVEKALKGESAKSVKDAGAKRIAALKASDALDSKKENDKVQTN